MQTLHVTLTEDGRFKQTNLPVGETKDGNIVYRIINIPDDVKSGQVIVWIRMLSPNNIKDYTIDYGKFRKSGAKGL